MLGAQLLIKLEFESPYFLFMWGEGIYDASEFQIIGPLALPLSAFVQDFTIDAQFSPPASPL